RAIGGVSGRCSPDRGGGATHRPQPAGPAAECDRWSHSMTADWASANQAFLMAALGVVRATLERHVGKDVDDSAERALGIALDELPSPPALDVLGDALGLSAFERDVLVLCAGVELHSEIAPLLTTLQADSRATRPTFSLALAALPNA